MFRIESGDPSAAKQLLPLVYVELRKLAAAKLISEKPGQTLQATALVREAYLRLVGNPTQGATTEPKTQTRPAKTSIPSQLNFRVVDEATSP